MLRSPTLWEETVKIIATTNTTWHQTTAMMRRLVEELGDPILDHPSLHAFPTAEQVAAGEEALAQRVRMGYRNASVLEQARRIAEERLALESYWETDLSLGELRRELKRL